jgi:hypothetical protein
MKMKKLKCIENVGKMLFACFPHFIYHYAFSFKYIWYALIASNSKTNNLGISTNGKKECVILGNGPSLKGFLKNEQNLGLLRDKFIITVNDAVSSSYFGQIRPACHVLIDPSYWEDNLLDIHQSRMNQFKQNMMLIDWPIDLVMPKSASKKTALNGLKENTYITFKYVNFSWPKKINIERLRFMAYKINKKAPDAQNVLIACCYIAINVGSTRIILIGADHSWHRSICVDDKNCVCWDDSHHYDNEGLTLTPILKDLRGTEVFSMAEILEALMITFKGYEEIEKYARYMGVEIFNATKGSSIDAFKRISLDSMTHGQSKEVL